MKLETIIQGRVAILKAVGRLDATWSDHLHSGVQELIREGHHEVRIHAAGIDYVSSAGIRSLLKIKRELAALNGTFGITAASDFMVRTLEMSGLQSLLVSDNKIAEDDSSTGSPTVESGISVETHTLNPQGGVELRVDATWTPWQPVADTDIHEIAFPQTTFALGVGAPGENMADARSRMGEFIAAAGCLAWLPTDGSDSPDYLEQTERLIPTLRAIQCIRAEGAFSHLLRFQPSKKGDCITLSELVKRAFETVKTDAVALLALAEVDGLVGSSLCRSPCLIGPGEQPGHFPEVRNWLAFCGERLHRQSQALVVGFACRNASHPRFSALPPISSEPDIRLHAHALALPYRAIQQGVVEPIPTIRAAFQESEPVNLLHLLEDDRPVIGLGQSAFIRGACWCAPVTEVTP